MSAATPLRVEVVSDGKDAVKVAKAGLKHADREAHDVVIVDTAGRLHVDEEMMREARRVKDAIAPHHVLMACDAMTGQDAVVQAKAFMREVDTTGFVLTKLDGDARGGAALSITAVTGRPVFFVGTGEKPADLEPFFPDRMASRIMGMGDVLSLIDKAQENLDQDKAAEAAKKMLEGAPNQPEVARALRGILIELDTHIAQLRLLDRGPTRDEVIPEKASRALDKLQTLLGTAIAKGLEASPSTETVAPARLRSRRLAPR